MIRASSTTIALTAFVALAAAAMVPASAVAADPGPPPGIPAAPSSEIAQQRMEREAADAVSSEAANRTTAWQDAVNSANGPHLDEIAEPRALAAIGGTIWFILAARSQWRRRRRDSLRTR